MCAVLLLVVVSHTFVEILNFFVLITELFIFEYELWHTYDKH